MNKNFTKNVLERFSCSIVGRGKKVSGYKILLESLLDLRQNSSLFTLNENDLKKNSEKEAFKPSSLLSVSSLSSPKIVRSAASKFYSHAEKIKQIRKTIFTNFRFKSAKKIIVIKRSNKPLSEKNFFYKRFKIVNAKTSRKSLVTAPENRRFAKQVTTKNFSIRKKNKGMAKTTTSRNLRPIEGVLFNEGNKTNLGQKQWNQKVFNKQISTLPRTNLYNNRGNWQMMKSATRSPSVIAFKRDLSFLTRTTLHANCQHPNESVFGQKAERGCSQFVNKNPKLKNPNQAIFHTSAVSKANSMPLKLKLKNQKQRPNDEHALQITDLSTPQRRNQESVNLSVFQKRAPLAIPFVSNLRTRLSLEIAKKFALKGKSNYSFCVDCISAVKPILETRKLRKGRMTYRVPKVTSPQRQEGKAISLLIEQANSGSSRRNDLQKGFRESMPTSFLTKKQNTSTVKKSTPLKDTLPSSKQRMSSREAAKPSTQNSSSGSKTRSKMKIDEKTEASSFSSVQHTTPDFTDSFVNYQNKKTRSNFLTFSSAWPLLDYKKQPKKRETQLVDKNAFLTNSSSRVMQWISEPSKEDVLPIENACQNSTPLSTCFDKEGDEGIRENAETYFTKSSVFLRNNTNSSKEQNKQNIKNGLALAFFDSGHGKGESVEKKKQLHKFALQNRAYLHFRWW